MLLFFYGEECPHCHRMMPLLDRLEAEHGVKFERLETWHDAENARKLKEYDPGGEKCGGVPFFYNTNTQAFVCGEVPYEDLLPLIGDAEEADA